MKFYNGEKCEIVLKPTDLQISEMIQTATVLMNIKMNDWILDQLTIEQLVICIEQFEKEIEKRTK